MEIASEPLTCRICLDDDVRRHLIAPCACRGSQRWVHRACLDKWRATKEDRAFSRCTECLASYQLICITNDNSCDKCKRHVRYSFFVTRDLFLAVLASQACIFLLGLVFFSFDHKNHSLAQTFHMEGHLASFYYLTGLFSFLSLLGVVFTCVRGQMCGQCRGLDGMEHCRCDDVVISPCWCYVNPDTALCCQGCSCDACCAGSAGDCVSSSLSALGQELLILFLMLAVVFAVIGVFVCIFVGVLVLQTIVTRHLHILQKMNLTQEYLVQDLAEGADNTLSTLDSSSHESGMELIQSHRMQRNGMYSPVLGGEDLEAPSAPPLLSPMHSRNAYNVIGHVDEGGSEEKVESGDAGVFLSGRQREELTRMGLL